MPEAKNDNTSGSERNVAAEVAERVKQMDEAEAARKREARKRTRTLRANRPGNVKYADAGKRRGGLERNLTCMERLELVSEYKAHHNLERCAKALHVSFHNAAFTLQRQILEDPEIVEDRRVELSLALLCEYIAIRCMDQARKKISKLSAEAAVRTMAVAFAKAETYFKRYRESPQGKMLDMDTKSLEKALKKAEAAYAEFDGEEEGATGAPACATGDDTGEDAGVVAEDADD